MATKKATIKITPSKFRELLKMGYSLDHICLMSFAEREMDITDLTETKEKALFQSLLRKQLINEDGSLSALGTELLELTRARDTNPVNLGKLNNDAEFKEWWAAFPGTDSVIVNGKVRIKGARSLKKNPDECRVKFNKILNEKQYTKDQLIGALKYEVDQRIDRSIKQGSNDMKYMNNSLTYLNQRGFEGFIELLSMEEENNYTKPGVNSNDSDSGMFIL